MDSEVNIFKEKLDALIEQARRSGETLDAEKVRRQFAGFDMTSAQLTSVTDYIIRSGIDYDDSLDRASQKETAQPEENDLSLPEDIGENDPIREYVRELKQQTPLSAGEKEMQIRLLLDGDDDAEQILIEGSLRRVIAIAREYHGRGVPFDDLVQDGNAGLIEGVSEYKEYGRKYKMTFDEFITGCVRSAMMKSITEQSRDIGIGDQLADTLNEAKKVNDELEESLGREPTREEIAEELGISPERLADMAELVKDPGELENLTDNKNGGTDGQKSSD